jgi:hypothetical protein
MTDIAESDIAVVRTMVAAAGLPASEAEIRAFAGAYRLQRAAADALYAVPAARYVDPALRFRADARITDWSE